ncbi:MAG TPA: NAD-dependent epimerase/dehydratase family protein [Gemmatimonadaceae bacterium]|nr:NAD-dependent epimerase/dehydratase family protein [Gemmatimonadaceae bacterium]
MRAFVTGGSGFMGRTLIGELRARGHDVRALARTQAAADAVSALGATPVRGDLDEELEMRAGMQGCDVVFHLAGKITGWGRADEFQRVNVEGTERVLHAARAAGVPRVVHVSTESVLLDGRPLRGVDESARRATNPVGLYSRTKAQAEERVLELNSPELATVVVRPRFVWGKGDTSVLPQLVDAVRRGQFKWIDGGRYQTSTCHVRNVCEGLMLAAERGTPGQVYFLTDGPPVEFRTFITDLLRTQGVDPGSGSIPRPVARAAAAASEWAWRTFGLKSEPPVTRYALAAVGQEVTVNDAKARRDLGYVGRVSREEGLREMNG